MFTPSFTPRGKHSLQFRRMEGQTENFIPGDNCTSRGQSSLLGDNYAPGGVNFDPRVEVKNGPLDWMDFKIERVNHRKKFRSFSNMDCWTRVLKVRRSRKMKLKLELESDGSQNELQSCVSLKTFVGTYFSPILHCTYLCTFWAKKMNGVQQRRGIFIEQNDVYWKLGCPPTHVRTSSNFGRWRFETKQNLGNCSDDISHTNKHVNETQFSFFFYLHAYVSIYICIYIHVYLHTCVFTYKCIYMYINIHLLTYV
jgi:hypothetical protein